MFIVKDCSIKQKTYSPKFPDRGTRGIAFRFPESPRNETCWGIGIPSSGIAAGLNFYLLPMALSLSWAILGINREQLKTRVFG